MSRELSCASDVARCREGSGQRPKWHKVATYNRSSDELVAKSLCCSLLRFINLLWTIENCQSSNKQQTKCLIGNTKMLGRMLE